LGKRYGYVWNTVPANTDGQLSAGFARSPPRLEPMIVLFEMVRVHSRRG
jgi:hypothetical protein